MLAGVALAVLVGVVCVLAEWDRAAGVTVLLMLGAGLALLLDLRRRAGEIASMQRRAAERSRAIADAVSGQANEVRRLGDDVDDMVATLAAPIGGAFGKDGLLAQMERRFLASFEAERLLAGDRHREIQEQLAGRIEHPSSEFAASLEKVQDRVAAVVGDAHARTDRRLLRGIRDATRDGLAEVEALLQAYQRAKPRALMPAAGGFALNARSVTHLLDIVRDHRPRRILELGSGTSTVWLAYALEGSGASIVSIDHDPDYAARTRNELARHGLTNVADVRLAALAPVGEEGQLWYGPAAFDGLDDIDLLLVDGPPESVGPMSRYPAVPQLIERLSSRALVLLDDSDRPSEAETVARWTTDYPFVLEDRATSRISVLRRRQT